MRVQKRAAALMLLLSLLAFSPTQAVSLDIGAPTDIQPSAQSAGISVTVEWMEPSFSFDWDLERQAFLPKGDNNSPATFTFTNAGDPVTIELKHENTLVDSGVHASFFALSAESTRPDQETPSVTVPCPGGETAHAYAYYTVNAPTAPVTGTIDSTFTISVTPMESQP